MKTVIKSSEVMSNQARAASRDYLYRVLLEVEAQYDDAVFDESYDGRQVAKGLKDVLDEVQRRIDRQVELDCN